MAFSQTQFETLIEKINDKLEKLSKDLVTFGDKINGAVDHWYVPGPVAKAVVAAANKLIEFVNWILTKIGHLLEGVVAPVILFIDANSWKGRASTATRPPPPPALRNSTSKPPRSGRVRGPTRTPTPFSLSPPRPRRSRPKRIRSRISCSPPPLREWHSTERSLLS